MKNYSTGKKILYGIITVVIFIFLVESMASIADYQLHGKYSFATIALFQKP